MAYENGPTTQYNSFNAGVIPNDVYGVSINWYVNRTPLFSRLPRLGVGSAQFLITNDDYRPRTFAIGADLNDTTDVTLTYPSTASLEVGDVVEIGSEKVLVTAVPSSTTATITRAYAGSTEAAHTSGDAAYLITNTRTGAEVDVTAVSRIPSTVVQNVQTIQHAYSVGGALQADTNYVAGGEQTPLQRDVMMATQHVVDDYEGGAYYGTGVALAGATTKPAMKGLRTLITTNNTTSPTNANAYKPDDLIRDTVQACYSHGGNPNILIVSTDFLSGLAKWGHAAMRINAGSTVFGTPIDLFEAPFLNGISIIPAPLLRAGTCICLSGAEVRNRIRRPMFDKPRGSRGDAFEGDIIMDGAIELDNQAHHAWVSGITAFSAS